MTHDQHTDLLDYAAGLAATLDALETLNGSEQRDTCDGLLSAALVMSRKLRELVNAIEPEDAA